MRSAVQTVAEEQWQRGIGEEQWQKSSGKWWANADARVPYLADQRLTRILIRHWKRGWPRVKNDLCWGCWRYLNLRSSWAHLIGIRHFLNDRAFALTQKLGSNFFPFVFEFGQFVLPRDGNSILSVRGNRGKRSNAPWCGSAAWVLSPFSPHTAKQDHKQSVETRPFYLLVHP